MRCYRTLLRLYPRDFLREYEPLLCQAFGDLSRRAMGSGGHMSLMILWLRTLGDLFSSAIAQRFGRNSDWRFPLRWILACTCGIPLGLALLLVLSSTNVLYARDLLPRQPSLFAFLFPVVASSIISAPVAWLQSRALEWRRVWRLAWTVTTILGVGSGWGSMYFFNRALGASVAFHPVLVPAAPLAVCGVTIGLFQMAVLILRSKRAWAWPPACSVATVAAGLLIAAVESTYHGFRLSHVIWGPMADEIVFLAIGAFVGGAVFGLFTASPLEWIMQLRNVDEGSSRSVANEER